MARQILAKAVHDTADINNPASGNIGLKTLTGLGMPFKNSRVFVLVVAQHTLAGTINSEDTAIYRLRGSSQAATVVPNLGAAYPVVTAQSYGQIAAGTELVNDADSGDYVFYQVGAPSSSACTVKQVAMLAIAF